MEINNGSEVVIVMASIAVVFTAISLAIGPVLNAWRGGRPVSPAQEVSVSSEVLEAQSRKSVERLANRVALEKYDVGVRRLLEQMEEAGLAPVWRPNGELKRLREGSAPEIVLYDLIREFFNDSDLDDLLFRLSIPAGEVRGVILSQRVQALIGYCNRRGRLGVLVRECRKLRPFLQWPEID